MNWRRFLGGLTVLMLAGGGVLAALPAATLVEVRNFLFTRWVPYPGPLTAPPAADLNEASAAVALRPAFDHLPWLADTLRSISNDPDVSSRARRVVGIIARGGRDRCLGDIPLAERIVQLRRGVGCCSDHSKVFMALGKLVGLHTREIGFGDHVAAEFYRSESNRWEFIDPLFAVQAVDTAGTPVALQNLWESVRSQRGASFVPIDSLGQWMIKESPRFRRIYYIELPEAASLRLTLGSDVIGWDRAERRLDFLPRPARLMVAYLKGERSWYAGLRPGVTPAWRGVRNLSASAALAGILLLPVGLVGLLYHRLGRRQ